MGTIITLFILYFAFSFVRALTKPFIVLLRTYVYELYKAMSSLNQYHNTGANTGTGKGPWYNNWYSGGPNYTDKQSHDYTKSQQDNWNSGFNNSWNSNTKKYMTSKEAREVLGVSDTASRDDIMKSYKRLMMINHPDKGGSQYLAGKIIEAKETLLS